MSAIVFLLRENSYRNPILRMAEREGVVVCDCVFRWHSRRGDEKPGHGTKPENRKLSTPPPCSAGFSPAGKCNLS